MSVLVSDKLQVKDCESCHVAQAQFEGLCALCHFRRVQNEKFAQIEPDEFVLRFWAKVLAWFLAACLAGAIILLSGKI